MLLVQDTILNLTSTFLSNGITMNKQKVWLWDPSKPHSSYPLHGVLWAKSSMYSHPPIPKNMAQVCGWNLGCPKGKENKQNFLQHINSVDPAIKFSVEDKREDGAIPFWTPLLNQRLMISYLLLYIRSPLTWTSIYSGIATTTSQLHKV